LINSEKKNTMKNLFYILFSILIPININSQHIPNEAYISGENLRYTVSFGFITAGRASLNLQEREINGKKFHYAVATGQSSGIVNALYKVLDVYETIMEAETALPVKAVRNISENNYKLYEEVIFNRNNNTIKSDRKGVNAVPEGTVDMLSAFYLARRSKFNDLKKGDIITIPTWFDDKVYDLEIRYYGNETIKTKIGRINCMKFSPVVEPGRIFDSPDDVSIWISNDNNKIPVRVQFNLLVGSVKCDLVEYENLKNNFAIIGK